MSSSDRDGDNGELGAAEYLVYRVVSERHSRDNQETSRTRIHKLCCLVDRRLNDVYDRNIGLPKYWYKYGRTIDESLINRSVLFTPRANHFPGQAYYPADQISESDFDHLPEDLKDDIYQAVIEIIDEHGDKSAEKLQEYQYNNFAPNEFIRAYADLRWHLAYLSTMNEDQDTFDRFLDRKQKSRIEEMLDEMLAEFDEEEYQEIYSLYLDWDDTLRLMNELGRSPREMLDFLEMFVEAIAKIAIRFNDNSNISEGKFSEWEEEKSEVKTDLRNKIQRKRKEAIKQRDYQGSLEAISESYNEAIFEELEDM